MNNGSRPAENSGSRLSQTRQGWATIRRLSPESAVILMTAFVTPEVTQGALDLGAFQVIHKRFEMHDLEPILLKACGSRRVRP